MRCRRIGGGSGEKGDAVSVDYESDDTYGTPSRRALGFGTTPAGPGYRYEPVEGQPHRPPTPSEAAAYFRAMEAYANGPEAHQRAAVDAYELTTRIQRESPFSQEVVEHQVHDGRLYAGMWVIAAFSFLLAMLSGSGFPLFLVGLLALGLALFCTPGRQFRESAAARQRQRRERQTTRRDDLT